MATYRRITASSYAKAVSQLKKDETLVAANYGDIRIGHIPVTCSQTFESSSGAGHKFYARKS